jgi:hypothetical protein
MSNEWDAFLSDAEKDTRVGKHEFCVTSVVQDSWPSGDARFKIKGTLLTAGNAKCDMTMSAMPTLEAAQAETDPKRKRGIALSVRNHLALQKYGKTIEQVAEGDVFRVETGKDKEGFVRVMRILGAEESVEVKAPKTGVPF